MANSPVNANRLYDGGVNFSAGMNSAFHPTLINPQGFSWLINCSTKGNILKTRPGYLDILRVLDGRAQGFAIFTPTGSVPTAVMAVSGQVWISEFPFDAASQLPNIQFDPYVDQVTFQECLQLSNAGTRIPPKAVLIMQDGRSRAAFWDGSTCRHLNPGQGETPTGLAMAFVGGRLWLALGKEIFAGDIYDPLHFTETQYLSGGGSFQAVDGQVITALCKTADSKALVAFTISGSTALRAGILDRSLWANTPDFVTELFPGVGAVGAKAFTYLNGELWWFSVEGVRRWTQVGSAIQTSLNTVASVEMKRSFDNLSPILSRVCAFSYGSNVGFSVPSGDIYNRHTWIIDVSTASTLDSQSAPAWQGIWMGTRPVQWATAVINGKSGCFQFSQDRDGGVRIWEAYQADQMDDGYPIFCSAEGPGLLFGAKESLAFKRFLYTEIHAIGLLGSVSLTAEYRGDYGCWKKILDIPLCATRCVELNCGSSNTAPSSQARYLQTQEAKQPACETKEGPWSDDIGTFFQNRFRWWGVFGVYKYRSQSYQWQEPSNGACMKGDASDFGLITCKEKLCCDPEIDYISHPNDHHYGSGTTHASNSSI